MRLRFGQSDALGWGLEGGSEVLAVLLLFLHFCGCFSINDCRTSWLCGCWQATHGAACIWNQPRQLLTLAVSWLWPWQGGSGARGFLIGEEAAVLWGIWSEWLGQLFLSPLVYFFIWFPQWLSKPLRTFKCFLSCLNHAGRYKVPAAGNWLIYISYLSFNLVI